MQTAGVLHLIVCKGCGVKSAHYAGNLQEETIAAWNRRAASAAPAPTNVDDNLKATDGPLLELDVLLARLHEDVWESAIQSLCAFDEAGVEEAKAIQRHVRNMLASAAPAEGREAVGERAALPDEVKDALTHAAGRWRGAACTTHDDYEGNWRSSDYQRRAKVIEDWLDSRTALATAPTTQCKLCNSSGPDMPCAYPTEINRQQAKRIAELETRLATAPTMSEAVRTLPDRKEVTDPWGYDEGGNYECGYANGWNECLEEIAEIDRANAEKKD